MPTSPEHTLPTLEAADAALLSLINKGHDIHEQIEALQAKLDIIDRSADAAFRARNELAEQHGTEVFLDLGTFVEAAS